MTRRVKSLADEYAAQFQWRAWDHILDRVPILKDQLVLDLGCASGDLAQALSDRGSRVIGLDANKELLDVARARDINGAEFVLHDLSDRLPVDNVDGIWCSFTAAYFCDFVPALKRWMDSVVDGGWIVLTEVDDMFVHQPLAKRTKTAFEAFAEDAISNARYDFRMGRKLRSYVEQSGLRLLDAFVVKDLEFSFDGPALPAVLDAWRDRLSRMRVLEAFCGDEFDEIRRDFIGALASSAHTSDARVHCVIAMKEVTA